MARQTTDPLSERHRLAAELVAEGHGNRAICERLSIGESTLLRWKRREDFRTLVSEFLPPGQPSPLKEYSLEVLENVRDDEIILMTELRETLEAVVRVVRIRIKHLDETEISQLPVRLIPTFLNCFADGLGTLQNAHDRLSGYSLLMKELGQILESDSSATKVD